MGRFSGRLLRIKGILAVAGVEERTIVQGVADLVEITFGEPWGNTKRTNRVAIVGFGLGVGSLEPTFTTCAADLA